MRSRRERLWYNGSNMNEARAETYTMRQASKILGVPSYRLRRYCRQGLVPGARVTKLGHEHTFTNDQMNALKRAHFLTLAGFTAKDARKFVGLMASNEKSAAQEARALLNTHIRQVWQQVEELQRTIDFLEQVDDEIADDLA